MGCDEMYRWRNDSTRVLNLQIGHAGPRGEAQRAWGKLGQEPPVWFFQGQGRYEAGEAG